MESIEYQINDNVSARKCIADTGIYLYLIDSKGNELAEVNLVNGVDLSYFLRIIRDEAKSE